MGHLNIRMTPQDENNLAQLMSAWHLDSSSETTRRALAITAEQIKSEKRPSKNALLKNSKFIGCAPSVDFSSTNYKEKLKASLKKKYGLQ